MGSVSVGVVLSWRRTQCMGCDSGPPLNKNWVGRPTSCVSCRQAQHDSRASIEWMLARTGDSGGMNKR